MVSIEKTGLNKFELEPSEIFQKWLIAPVVRFEIAVITLLQKILSLL